MQPGDGHHPILAMYKVAASSTALSRRELYATQSGVLQPFQQYGWAHSSGSLADSHTIPGLPYMVGRGLLFQVQFDQMIHIDSESMEGIQPGDSGVIIGIRLMCLFALVHGADCYLFTHVPWVHG